MLFPQIVHIRATEGTFDGFEMKPEVIGFVRIEDAQKETSPFLARGTTELRLPPDRSGGDFVSAILIHQLGESRP